MRCHTLSPKYCLNVIQNKLKNNWIIQTLQYNP